ncbi:MAG: hypothetical protein ACI3YH_03945 [Eubacteriales bacterium]
MKSRGVACRTIDYEIGSGSVECASCRAVLVD